MKVFVQKTGELNEITHQGDAASLLAKLGINSETVLIVKDGALITEDESVDDAKRIDLLSVVSGG